VESSRLDQLLSGRVVLGEQASHARRGHLGRSPTRTQMSSQRCSYLPRKRFRRSWASLPHQYGLL